MSRPKWIFKSRLHAAIAILVAIGLIALWLVTPSYEQVVEVALGSDRVLLAADGQVLQTLRTDFNKRRLAWYGLENFPQNLKEAVLLAEDQRFEHHFGFDPFGIGRALKASTQGGPVQGASTITMQLTDLIQDDVLLRDHKITKGSLPHKVVQLVRALGLELRWNKKQILEAYLNLVHLRGEYQGVPAVAMAYLNKYPLALELDESFAIASMISSPNRSQAALTKKACALAARSPTHDDCAKVTAAVAGFFREKPSVAASAGSAPHLARRLFDEANGGKHSVLRSTINFGLQEKVTAILDRNILRLKDSNVHDSAAIVIDNKTGEVLAYVGAVSTSESPHVDGIQAYRQAGSTLKPFIYAKTLESKRLTAASILIDEPTVISWGGAVYRPSNYDQHFNGPVSVREALASSLNVPAVKAATILGLSDTYKTLETIGLTKLKEPEFYGVSMALGAVEVRLEDLANAYRILANGGKWSPLEFTSGAHGMSVAGPRQVLTPEVSFIISSILSDPNARSIGFGWNNPLETPFWTAVKTGTSKDYRDNWCVGFSSRYTVAVWNGNFDATAMRKVSGVSGAGPSWAEIMNVLHAQEKSTPPDKPAGVVAKNIRHQWASQPHLEYFIKGTEPDQELIEPSQNQRVQFVFPIEGSVLVKDPHLDQERIALYARFKGSLPEQSQLVWDGKNIGAAASPTRLPDPMVGTHVLGIVAPDGRTLDQVHFMIKGAD